MIVKILGFIGLVFVFLLGIIINIQRDKKRAERDKFLGREDIHENHNSDHPI